MAAADEETVILTTKRSELFLFDSRLFRIVDENQNNLSVYYKCNTNPGVKCGGRLIRTAVGEIIQTVACLATGNCATSPAAVTTDELKSNLR